MVEVHDKFSLPPIIPILFFPVAIMIFWFTGSLILTDIIHYKNSGVSSHISIILSSGLLFFIFYKYYYLTKTDSKKNIPKGVKIRLYVYIILFSLFTVIGIIGIILSLQSISTQQDTQYVVPYRSTSF